LGCNNDQIPYLRALQNLGYTVVGTDMNANAPGASLVDRFYCVSYTDVDGLMRVAEAERWDKKDRLFTAAAHFAYEGASGLAARLGVAFIRPETVDTCLDKVKLYALLKEHHVPVPPTRLYDQADRVALDPDKIYFFKSDYGKSPKYCYRVDDGRVPPLCTEHDAFYRRHFLIQEGVVGSHFRVNLYADQVAVFLKLGDEVALPVRVLGPGHGDVVKKLRGVTSALGLEAVLTKFDLIVDQGNWYAIDIGLDPPLRLRLLCEHLDIDFAQAYTRYYMLGDAAAIPVWSDICRPVIIQGSPQRGFTFIDLGGPT